MKEGLKMAGWVVGGIVGFMFFTYLLLGYLSWLLHDPFDIVDPIPGREEPMQSDVISMHNGVSK